MDRNTVTNQLPDAPRPLSLEEAIAMAPPEASSPFATSTAAIAWGAVRSGQSVWEFLIGMTREFEEKLQAGYEAWKAENAWYPSGSAHADGEAVVSEEPHLPILFLTRQQMAFHAARQKVIPLPSLSPTIPHPARLINL